MRICPIGSAVHGMRLARWLPRFGAERQYRCLLCPARSGFVRRATRLPARIGTAWLRLHNHELYTWTCPVKRMPAQCSALWLTCSHSWRLLAACCMSREVLRCQAASVATLDGVQSSRVELINTAYLAVLVCIKLINVYADFIVSKIERESKYRID